MLSRRLRDQGCQVNALEGRFVQQPLVWQYENAAYLALARALDARVLTTDRGLEAAARSDRRLVAL